MRKRVGKLILMLSVLPLSSCGQEITGSITFHFNGGEANNVTEASLNEAFKGVSETVVTTAVPDLERENYFFLGWYEHCTYSETDSNICASYSNKVDFSKNNVKIPYGDAHVYAVFRKKQVIKFNFNQSYYDSSMTDSVSYLEGYENKTLNKKDIPSSLKESEQIENHAFSNKWYLTKECNDSDLVDFSKYSSFTSELPSEVFGKWVSNPTITFLPGNNERVGSFEGGIDFYTTNEYKYNEVFDIKTLPNLNAPNSNAKFDGWYVAKKSESEIGSFTYTDQKYTFGVNEVGNDDIILYAKWVYYYNVVVNYPDSYVLNFGSIKENSSLTQEQITQMNREIPDKYFDNFTFTGEGGVTTFDPNTAVVTSDLVLIANYVYCPIASLKYKIGDTLTDVSLDESHYCHKESYLLGLGSLDKQTLDVNVSKSIIESKISDLLQDYYISGYYTYQRDETGNHVTDGSGNDKLVGIDGNTLCNTYDDPTVIVELKQYYKFTYNTSVIKLIEGDVLTFQAIDNIVDSGNKRNIYKLTDGSNVVYVDSSNSYGTNSNSTIYSWTIELTENFTISVKYQSEVIVSQTMSEGTRLDDLYNQIQEAMNNKGFDNYYFVVEGTETEIGFPTVLDKNYSLEVKSRS